MEIIDDKVERLLAQALYEAGVLASDEDMSELRRYALKRYRRLKVDYPRLKRQALLEALVKSIIKRRHRGWAYRQPERVYRGQQQAGRYKWLEVQPTKQLDLAHLVQLTPQEREVLYLLVVVGLTPEQIVAELNVSGDWVMVTISKLRQIYGQVW